MSWHNQTNVNRFMAQNYLLSFTCPYEVMHAIRVCIYVCIYMYVYIYIYIYIYIGHSIIAVHFGVD